MKKSKDQKRKEATFRNVRGDIVNLCRNFKSLLNYYTTENYDDLEQQPNFILEKNNFRQNLLILIAVFENYEDDLKKNAFDSWVDMDEDFKSLFVQTYKEITDEEKLFFSYF